jgi:AraC family transcriptional regulator, transcriptional activator of pobA
MRPAGAIGCRCVAHRSFRSLALRIFFVTLCGALSRKIVQRFPGNASFSGGAGFTAALGQTTCWCRVAVHIPDYALYGEPLDKQFAERLHIETVPQRSAAHSWRIRPHRHHGLYQLFWIESGGGELQIEDTRRTLSPPLAIFVPPLVVHGFNFEPGTDGFVASLPVATLAEVLAPTLQSTMDRALLLPQRRAPGAFVNPRELFEDAFTEHSRNLPGRSEALHAHAALLGIWFLRASGSATGLGRPGAQTRTLLLRRFLEVIERRFAEQPSVAKIAKELGVSPPYLTRACRELLGRPAHTLVHDRIILEAKRCLGFTSMPVSQIAYALGFADPAYFSRFFRDRVGVNPSVYRATLAEAERRAHD